ncbi:MAG: hypothetical protein OXC07_04810, partial [Kistimonas sp.]|nr:hypothetical protein [Kistimonas sp.]
MNNFSVGTGGNSTSVQGFRGAGGLGRQHARVLVHTVAALSVLGPRRAGPGRRSKNRAAAVVTSGQAPMPSVIRQTKGENRHAGVRVRESTGAEQRTLQKEKDGVGQELQQASVASNSRKGKKGAKARGRSQRRQAPVRTEAEAAAGKGRKQKRADVLDDFSIGRRQASSARRATDESVSHRRGRRQADYTDTPVAL